MQDNISPEERLLRLIKGEKKQDVALNKKITPDTPVLKLPPKGRIYHLPHIHLSFEHALKFIIAVIAISFVYLVASLIYPWLGLSRIKLPVMTKEENTAEQKIGLKSPLKPYEFYLEGIKNRSIFTAGSTAETSTPLNKADLDLIKDISLVGIISGEVPQAIIEDKKNQKTYYLSKGQFFGELQLEDIQEGKVILNYAGRRFELYL